MATFGGANDDGDDWGGWGQRVYTPGRSASSATRPVTGPAKPSACAISCATTASTPAELDEVLRAMRQLDDDRVYKDARELERLQTLVAEGLKRFEFGLRRKVEDAQGDQPALTATDEVPRGYRDLVEEYSPLALSPRRS